MTLTVGLYGIFQEYEKVQSITSPPAERALAPFPPSSCGIFSIANRLGY
jgi:hypothetical protein